MNQTLSSKIFALFALIIGFAITVQAQSTKPRTSREVVKIATNDAAGADTIKLIPNAWRTIVMPADSIRDSVVYTIRTNAQSNLIVTGKQIGRAHV